MKKKCTSKDVVFKSRTTFNFSSAISEHMSETLQNTTTYRQALARGCGNNDGKAAPRNDKISSV